MPYSTHDSIPSRLKHGESAVVGKTVSVANIHLGNITSNCPAEHLSHTTGEVGSFTRQLLLGDCVKSEVKSRNYSYFIRLAEPHVAAVTMNTMMRRILHTR